MLKSIVFGLAVLSAVPASAQPYRGGPGPRAMERAGDRREVARSQNQLRDDVRDLVRFQNTLAAFEEAWRRQDMAGVHGALQSFVQQGRMEVAEQRRETVQAVNEANRSANEAWRDRSRKDVRDARDDQRDARRESRELQEEESLLAELERTNQATWTFGPQVPILVRARQVMTRFVQLAQIEVNRSRQEVREDRRELREDRRGGPGWRR